MDNVEKYKIEDEKFYETKKELLEMYNAHKEEIDTSEPDRKLLSIRTIQERLKDGEYLSILSANIDFICDCVAFIYTMGKDEDELLSNIAKGFFNKGKIHRLLFMALHIGELLENKHKELTQNGD